jgi:hypothetical protein
MKLLKISRLWRLQKSPETLMRNSMDEGVVVITVVNPIVVQMENGFVQTDGSQVVVADK